MRDKGIIVWGKEGGGACPRPEADHDGSIIIWNTRDPLGGMTREVFEAEFRRILEGRVLEAWIFGSYGTPAFCRDSDIDVFLVTNTTKPFIERALDFDELRDLVPDMDILVYTPEEFRKLTGDPSPGFWRSAVTSMRRML